MVESYRVQAALLLNSNVAQVLAQASRELGAFDGKLRTMERRLNRVLGRNAPAVTALNDMAEAMTATARATEGFTRASERAATASGRRTQALESESRALVRYERAASAAARAGGALVPSPRLIGYDGAATASMASFSAGGGTGAYGLPALMAMGRVQAAGGGGGGQVPPALPLLAGAGGGGGMNGMFAAGLAGAFGRRGGGGGAGGGGGGSGGAGGTGGGGGGNLTQAAAMGAAGYATLNVIGQAIRAGGELQHQQTVLRAAGLDPAGVNSATARAWETTRLARGSRVAQNLDLFGALRGMFTDDEAARYLPEFARFNRNLGAITGTDPGRSGEYAARYLDLRDAFQDPTTGRIVPERGLGQLERMQSVFIATQGRVTPQHYLNFQQMAGVAGKRLSDDSIYGTLPSLIESMGGHRAGTALAAANRQIVSGIMTQRVADEMIRTGLIDRSKVEVRRGGHVVIRPGGVMNQQQFANDPVEWTRSTLLPQLRRAGFLTLDQQLEQLSRMFGTETGRRFFGEILASLPSIDRNAATIARVRGDAGGILQNESFRLATANLTAGWNNLMTALGTNPTVITIMNRLADALNNMADWARQNPAMAGTLMELAAALGALAVGAAVFALGGAVIGGLGALAGPVGLLALLGAGALLLWNALEGRDFSEKLASLAQGISNLWTRLLDNLGLTNRDASGNPRAPGGPAPGVPVMPRTDPLGNVIPQSFSPVPPASNDVRPIILNLDGRRVGEGVMPYLERALSGPVQAAARFDTRRALPGVEFGEA